MDKHIELSPCSFEGFKVLARNYLNVEKHAMFDRVQQLLAQVKMTSADIAEHPMPKSPTDDGYRCLWRLIQALEEAEAASNSVSMGRPWPHEDSELSTAKSNPESQSINMTFLMCKLMLTGKTRKDHDLVMGAI
ncbi:hypothetical protein MLD38_012533 [Melastoma candidum]|uniref:Uncharacterized protein n=1 Tax=Melastoma candidum TaxID=119954 RepID=A0ACB9R7X5_9MYRT|nr:hypothetical protein MLD38_012533 [Melastoma candidum]